MTRLLYELHDPIRMVTVDGVDWWTETDGRTLIARNDRTDAPTLDDGRTEGIVRLLRQALSAPTSSVDMASLSAFVGKPPVWTACEACRGTGHGCGDAGCTCSLCECEECGGGLGHFDRGAIRWVRIGGQCFDAGMLALAIEHSGVTSASAAMAPVPVCDGVDDPHRALVLRTETTCVVVMCAGRVYLPSATGTAFAIGGAS